MDNVNDYWFRHDFELFVDKLGHLVKLFDTLDLPEIISSEKLLSESEKKYELDMFEFSLINMEFVYDFIGNYVKRTQAGKMINLPRLIIGIKNEIIELKSLMERSTDENCNY